MTGPAGTSLVGVVLGSLRPVRSGRQYAEQEPPRVPGGRLVTLPDGSRTHVTQLAGPTDALPVVLLHGWTWNADLNYADVYAPLAERHPVIAPDVLGHGRSSRPSGRWRLADATDGVIALLDDLGIDRAIFSGYSLGGVMAADAAARHPDRVAGVVAQASAASYRSTLRNRSVWRLIALSDPVARLHELRGLSARGYSDSLRRSPTLRARWDWTQVELARMTFHDIAHAAAGISRIDLRKQLATPPDCPAEYTIVADDHVCQPPLQRELARLLGAVQREVVADHDLPLVDPAAYAVATVAAITRVAARASVPRSR